jgi:hypothetical protein
MQHLEAIAAAFRSALLISVVVIGPSGPWVSFVHVVMTIGVIMALVLIHGMIYKHQTAPIKAVPMSSRFVVAGTLLLDVCVLIWFGWGWWAVAGLFTMVIHTYWFLWYDDAARDVILDWLDESEKD